MKQKPTFCWTSLLVLVCLLTGSAFAQNRPRKATPTRPSKPAPGRVVVTPSARTSAPSARFAAHPGAGGIYLAFGRDLPKTFRYRLERSPAGASSFTVLTETAFPRLADEFVGRLNEAVAQLPASYVRFPKGTLAEARYHVLRRNATADSLAGLMGMPHYQIAAGLGYWDATAKTGMAYDYRLTRLDQEGSLLVSDQVRGVNTPGTYPATELRIDTVYATGMSVTLEYEVVSGRVPEVLHLYRGYYLRGGFEEVMASYYPIKSTNGRIRYKVIDLTAADKLQYSYYVVPGDYVGNRGTASPTYNLYNARPTDITFLPYQFRIKSNTAEKRLRLSWRIAPSKEITSVDVFRGDDFAKTFVRIGSVAAIDTVFYDRNVEPVRTYFYTLVVNTAYGKTYPSARVPALLEASEPNYSRPEKFRATQNGRLLTFTWERPGNHIYGYYLYRARNYDQKPEQVGHIIVSDKPIVTVTDTLPSQESDVWVYSVASVNTSYNIGPLSERLTFTGTTSVLPPTDLTARLHDGIVPGSHALHLIWTSRGPAAQRTTGFQVYRRLVTDNAATTKPADWQLLTKRPLKYETNFWADTTVREGGTYAYIVRTLGGGGGLSNPSPEARCTVAETYPAGVRNVRLLQSGTGVLMQWDAPFDPTIERLVVYRAESGKPLQKLTTLPRSAAQFIDKTPLARKTNYYQILAEDRRGHTSRNPDLIGLYVE